MQSGIYTIRNKVDNKIYVGASINIDKRLGEYKRELKGNYHKNKKLQRAYNQHGKEHFEFELLEECEERFLMSQENYWCNMFSSHDRKFGYNLDPTSPYKNHRLSAETKDKISAIRIKQYEDKTKNPFYGKKHSSETKRKISESGIGKIKRKHTEEEKKIRSERMKEVPTRSVKVLNIETGRVYNTINEACRDVGISTSVFYNYSRGKFIGNKKNSPKTKLRLL